MTDATQSILRDRLGGPQFAGAEQPAPATGDGALEGTPPAVKPAEVAWRILYLFAGRQRQADLEDALLACVKGFNESSTQFFIHLALIQVDTLRGGAAHDLQSLERQQDHIAAILRGEFDLVLVAPPCNTFSRAVFSNHPGPRPIRDRTWPRGFPWLEADKRMLADEANNLVDSASLILPLLRCGALRQESRARQSPAWRRLARRCCRRCLVMYSLDCELEIYHTLATIFCSILVGFDCVCD